MKKILCAILCLFLSVPALAAAEGNVVTALATELNPKALISVSVNARITGCSADGNTLTVELLVPERFDPEDILNLKAGDAIYTQGQEIEIKTITEKDGYIVLNEGDFEFSEGSVWLYEGLDTNYWIADWHDNSWLVLDTVRVPVPDRLLFLDEIDPSSGETLLQPTVHSGKEFLQMLEAEKKEGPGFETNNVSVVFDGNGDLALIRRYYVPWQ